MTDLVIAALAAALVAEFRSFPIALLAGTTHRRRRDRGGPVRRPAGLRLVGPVPRHRGLARRTRTGASASRLLPPTAALDRDGTDQLGVAGGRLRARDGAAVDVVDPVDRRDHGDTRGGDRAPVHRRADGLRGTTVAGAVRHRRIRCVGRRSPRRRPRRAVPTCTWSRRRRHRRSRRRFRHPGGADARHQPCHRHPRTRHRHRIDALPESRVHRRSRRHAGRQPARVRTRHRLDQPPDAATGRSSCSSWCSRRCWSPTSGEDGAAAG